MFFSSKLCVCQVTKVLQSCFYIYTAHIPSRPRRTADLMEAVNLEKVSTKQQLLENMAVVENHVIRVCLHVKCLFGGNKRPALSD